MKSREAADPPGGSMTTLKRMRIDPGRAEGTKERALNKRAEAAIPAAGTMKTKRKSQGTEGPPGDMRTMMRRVPMIVDQAADARTAETMMTARGMADPAAAVAQAGKAPTSDIMIEIKLSHLFSSSLSSLSNTFPQPYSFLNPDIVDSYP